MYSCDMNRIARIAIFAVLFAIFSTSVASSSEFTPPGTPGLNPDAPLSIPERSEEATNYMQTNPDFSKLINTLDANGTSTQFAMGSDGTVQVVAKSSDGVVTYSVNGVVVWNGCAYATCAVQPVPTPEPSSQPSRNQPAWGSGPNPQAGLIPSDSIPYSAEISEVAKTNPELSKLLDLLSISQNNSIVNTGSDGSIQVISKTSDGTITYTVDGTTKFQGCGYIQCNASLAPPTYSEEANKLAIKDSDFSKLLDSLNSAQSNSVVRTAADGTVLVLSKNSAGELVYSTNGSIAWQGCGFLTCSNFDNLAEQIKINRLRNVYKIPEDTFSPSKKFTIEALKNGSKKLAFNAKSASDGSLTFKTNRSLKGYVLSINQGGKTIKTIKIKN
jgi:hypothetical protein